VNRIERLGKPSSERIGSGTKEFRHHSSKKHCRKTMKGKPFKEWEDIMAIDRLGERSWGQWRDIKR